MSTVLMNNVSPKLPSVWHQTEVAAAQLELVTRELADESRVAPFQAFLRSMRRVLEHAPELEYGTLLDVGCGVGHYGVLVKRHFPYLDYVGCDASTAMCEQARGLLAAHEVTAALHVCDFWDTPFARFRLFLISQVMELQENPPAALQYVLQNVPRQSAVLFHRLRWTSAPAQVLVEKTYCDAETRNFVWNVHETMQTCLAYGTVRDVDEWSKGDHSHGYATLWFEKQ